MASSASHHILYNVRFTVIYNMRHDELQQKMMLLFICSTLPLNPSIHHAGKSTTLHKKQFSQIDYVLFGMTGFKDAMPIALQC